jgi:glycosyltransferase involved in cell wall biosynthesis
MRNVPPLFTVATISYNSGAWIKETIESVLASTFTNFEFLISDDASSDNTWEIITNYHDPRIRSWRNEKNIGEYPNRNKVLEQATGDYIFFVDGDDILYKNSLMEISKFIEKFPESGAIFGVAASHFDFIVFPFEFTPQQITKLMYLNTLPIAVVGFAETIFKRTALLAAGGFSECYVTGDGYIKKKIACREKVLMVPMGFSFWRQTEGQATKQAAHNFRSMIDSFFIDQEIINSTAFPLTEEEKKQVRINFKIRTIKLLFSNTLLRGKIPSFFTIFRQFGLGARDLPYLLQKGRYNYTCEASSKNPLHNNFNSRN